jgi:hypothetical protein
MTIFYCLRFETHNLDDPCLYPPGTEWPSYILRLWVPFSSPSTSRRDTVEVFETTSTQESCLASSQRQVKITLRLTVSQSVNLGVEPHLGLITIYLSLIVTVLFLLGVLSNERTGLSFVHAFPCQRSLSRVRVPWNS